VCQLKEQILLHLCISFLSQSVVETSFLITQTLLADKCVRPSLSMQTKPTEMSIFQQADG